MTTTSTGETIRQRRMSLCTQGTKSLAVKAFYEKTPFPNYDINRFDSRDDLKQSAHGFARILDRSISADASVIDVGTGTGQLAAFLSLRRKCVYGVDFSEQSLAKAKLLKEKLGLESLRLRNIDIMDRKQLEGIGMKFDYVLCFGVLHHTANAKRAFENVSSLLKPGGHIAVGLYNKFGRLPHKIRKHFAGSTDLALKKQIGYAGDDERAFGWWSDQYRCPHESAHTAGEVLKWFRQNGIEYVQAVPSLNILDESNTGIAGVWNGTNESYPSFPVRAYKQLSWIWRSREGGYFMMFGRRKR